VKPSRSAAPWTCIGLGRNKVLFFHPVDALLRLVLL